MDPGVIDPWVESLFDCVVESGNLSCWLVSGNNSRIIEMWKNHT